ncbi:hypothetical protein GCM10020220_093880 [Nonomuraea rubra]
MAWVEQPHAPPSPLPGGDHLAVRGVSARKQVTDGLQRAGQLGHIYPSTSELCHRHSDKTDQPTIEAPNGAQTPGDIVQAI